MKQGFEDELTKFIETLSPQAQGLFEDFGFGLTTECWSNIPRGWEAIIREAVEAIAVVDPLTKIKQIKDKFGGLRLYVNSNDASGRVDVIISLAEESSYRFCEWCSGKSAKQKQIKGFYHTLCDACYLSRFGL